MRTGRLFIALAAGAVLVSSCSLLPSAPLPLIAGSCLADSDSANSDFHSVVACTQPHRYDVIAVDTWPGMADALSEGGADDVYAQLLSADSEFWTWVRPWCSRAVRAAVGWSDVELDLETENGAAVSTDDIWAEPAGSFYVDISLPPKPDFVGGEHRVVCSAAWVDETGHQVAQSFEPGLGFADLIDPGLTDATRRCVDSEAEFVPCAISDVVAEQFATFDARVFPGPDSVIAVATAGDDDGAPPALVEFDAVCAALAAAVPHRPQAGPALAAVLDEYGEWSRVSRTSVLEDDVQYFVSCFAAPRATS
jgi:hypothetical protein